MTLGRRMRRARIDAGYSDVVQFGEALEVSPATLMAWEADIQRPSDDLLERFAELTGVDVQELASLASSVPQGICRAVDLVPDETQAQVLDEVGIPRALWDDPDRWVAFLRLAQAAAEMSPTQITLLSRNAESCISDV